MNPLQFSVFFPSNWIFKNRKEVANPSHFWKCQGQSQYMAGFEKMWVCLFLRFPLSWWSRPKSSHQAICRHPRGGWSGAYVWGFSAHWILFNFGMVAQHVSSFSWVFCNVLWLVDVFCLLGAWESVCVWACVVSPDVNACCRARFCMNEGYVLDVGGRFLPVNFANWLFLYALFLIAICVEGSASYFVFGCVVASVPDCSHCSFCVHFQH